MWSESNPHPLEPPPDVLPAERGVNVLQAAIVLPFVSFIFVALRFYVRVFIVKSITLADYVSFATMVASIAYSVLIARAAYNGMGLHVWQYNDALNERYYMWIGICSEFYALSLMGYKCAILLLYLQLFGVVKKFRIICYITLFYTVSYIFCNMMTQFLGCNPPEKNWKPDLPGHCINTIAANIAYGAGHMTSDLVIAILPLPMIWRLQFKTFKEKLGISIVLGSGFLAWAVACVRWGVATYDLVSYDRPYIAGLAFTFSILEVHTGIICACVPTLKPILRIAKEQGSTWAASRGSRKGSTSKGFTSQGSSWFNRSSRKGSTAKGSYAMSSNSSGERPFTVLKNNGSLPHIKTEATTSSDGRVEHEPMPQYTATIERYEPRNIV